MGKARLFLDKYDSCVSRLPARLCEAEAMLELLFRQRVHLERLSRASESLANHIMKYEKSRGDGGLPTRNLLRMGAAFAGKLNDMLSSINGTSAPIVESHPAYSGYLSKLKYVGSLQTAHLFLANFQAWRYPKISNMWSYWGFVPHSVRKPRNTYQKIVKAKLLFVVLYARSGVIAELKNAYLARLEEKGHPKPKPAAAYRAAKTLMKWYWIVYRLGLGLPLTLPYEAEREGKIDGGLPRTEDGVYLPECGEWLPLLGVEDVRAAESCDNARKTLLSLRQEV